MFSFIPAGSVVEPKPHTLYLDVGNHLKRGIIDHHQSGAPKASATRLVYENTSLIPLDTQTIIVHHSPDIDCVASSFLARYFLEHHTFPSFALALVEHVDAIDFGFSPKHNNALCYMYALVSSEIKEEQKCLELGHYMVKTYAPYGFDTGKIPEEYANYNKKLEEDYGFYLEDVQRAQKIKIFLPSKTCEDHSIKHDGLIIEYPKSKLFKHWARNDSLHVNNGFMFLAVRLGTRRTILSVKPDGDVYLKGFGDALNQAEKKKRASLGIVLNEPNREGYDMPDPWYDGRNPSHNYTIIDTPKRGSELSFEEILNLCLGWQYTLF